MTLADVLSTISAQPGFVRLNMIRRRALSGDGTWTRDVYLVHGDHAPPNYVSERQEVILILDLGLTTEEAFRIQNPVSL